MFGILSACAYKDTQGSLIYTHFSPTRSSLNACMAQGGGGGGGVFFFFPLPPGAGVVRRGGGVGCPKQKK
eukprot:COSAG05_NODE_11430_length_513_cov_9.033816_1_plen_69_part_10